MTDVIHLILTVLVPIIVVMAILSWWIKRMNIHPDMRWPRKKQGKRRTERELPPADPKPPRDPA